MRCRFFLRISEYADAGDRNLNICLTGIGFYSLSAAGNKKQLLHQPCPLPRFSLHVNGQCAERWKARCRSPGIRSCCLALPADRPGQPGTGRTVRENQPRDSIVHTNQALREKMRVILREYKQPVLVQSFLPGRNTTSRSSAGGGCG